jgi:hypothetical protein
LEPEKLFQKFQSIDYVLIIQPDNAKDFITTKIYEIIYTNIPFMLISNGGKLADFIQSNNLGYCFSTSTLESDFDSFFNSSNKKNNISTFTIEKYSYNNITLDLISNFKNLIINSIS